MPEKVLVLQIFRKNRYNVCDKSLVFFFENEIKCMKKNCF